MKPEMSAVALVFARPATNCEHVEVLFGRRAQRPNDAFAGRLSWPPITGYLDVVPADQEGRCCRVFRGWLGEVGQRAHVQLTSSGRAPTIAAELSA